eukprot:706802-Rhodomonas_salina.2
MSPALLPGYPGYNLHLLPGYPGYNLHLRTAVTSERKGFRKRDKLTPQEAIVGYQVPGYGHSTRYSDF